MSTSSLYFEFESMTESEKQAMNRPGIAGGSNS